MGDQVAELIRQDAARIARGWRKEVGDEPALERQVPELLAAVADWIGGDTTSIDAAFGSLVESPALQRLGYGIGLETLTRETGKLRVVLLRQLLCLPPTRELCASLIRLHEGMDRGIAEAVRRYAERREEVRDLFIGILGHDLRDPLGTIRITARILARNPRLRGHAERIEQACGRMQRLVDDVLDFARGHLGGGIPAAPAPCDMGALCRAAADEISAANPQRPFRVELHGDLHGNFDHDRVIQALANLLSNAVQHGEGPIEMAAYETPEHDAVITAVTSHGEPIPPEVLARIFDPFARAETSRAGLGLGLYIVQQIAQAHGAICDVHSSRDATTFAIRWPRGHVMAHRKAG
jgi:signal transduction histidine kinase